MLRSAAMTKWRANRVSELQTLRHFDLIGCLCLVSCGKGCKYHRQSETLQMPKKWVSNPTFSKVPQGHHILPNTLKFPMWIIAVVLRWFLHGLSDWLTSKSSNNPLLAIVQPPQPRACHIQVVLGRSHGAMQVFFCHSTATSSICGQKMSHFVLKMVQWI